MQYGNSFDGEVKEENGMIWKCVKYWNSKKRKQQREREVAQVLKNVSYKKK